MPRCYRKKNGKRHGYWALVESYRTARGPRQRVVAYLGELDEHDRMGVQQAVQPVSAAQADLFQQPRQRQQDPLLLAQRLGKLLGRNSRAAGLFRVHIKTDARGAAPLEWSKRDDWRDWARLSEGCYLLRSNVTDWSGEELWRAYMQLTEAEAAFRIHKSDLALRPVWHHLQLRVQAHILVCFLTYVLWKTFARWSHNAGLGDEPRKIFAELS